MERVTIFPDEGKGEQQYVKDDLKTNLTINSSTVDYNEYNICYYSGSSRKSCGFDSWATGNRRRYCQDGRRNGIK